MKKCLSSMIPDSLTFMNRAVETNRPRAILALLSLHVPANSIERLLELADTSHAARLMLLGDHLLLLETGLQNDKDLSASMGAGSLDGEFYDTLKGIDTRKRFSECNDDRVFRGYVRERYGSTRLLDLLPCRTDAERGIIAGDMADLVTGECFPFVVRLQTNGTDVWSC